MKKVPSMLNTLKVLPKPLAGLLVSVRSRVRRNILSSGLSGLVLGLCASAVVLMGCDWLFEWDRVVRGLLLGLVTAAAVWWLVRHLVQPLRRLPDWEGCALLVEKQAGGLRNLLISTLQLLSGPVPPGQSQQMIGATLREAERAAGKISPAQVVPLRQANKMLLRAGTVVAVVAAATFWGQPVTGVLWQRLFLGNEPVPRSTMVESLTGDRTVLKGDPLVLEAKTSGVIRDRARATLTFESGTIREADMMPHPSQAGVFTVSIGGAEESFSYVLRSGDGKSRTHRIRVQAPPRVVDLEIRQQFPEYTGLGTVVRSIGNLNLLAGSTVLVKGRFSEPVESAVLVLSGSDARIPLELERSGFAGSFPAGPATVDGFLIEMNCGPQLPVFRSPVYPLMIVADRPPTAAIRKPGPEETATAQARVGVEWEADDDYGLASAELLFRPLGSESKPVVVPVQTIGTGAKNIKGTFAWDLRKTAPALREGDEIEYWIEVRDRNQLTGPGRGAAPRQLLRIVSPSEKKAELLGQLLEAVDALEEVREDQKKAERTLDQTLKKK